MRHKEARGSSGGEGIASAVTSLQRKGVSRKVLHMASTIGTGLSMRRCSATSAVGPRLAS
jgi:hypothetical protein